jgi:hypothetical protein
MLWLRAGDDTIMSSGDDDTPVAVVGVADDCTTVVMEQIYCSI